MRPQSDPTATWYLTLPQRTHRLGRYIGDLLGWRDRLTLPLTDWTFTAPGTAPVPVKLGAPWPAVDQSVTNGPARFETTARVPEAWAGLPVELELDLGGEALVTIEGGVVGGLNPYHRRFPVTAAPGADVRIVAEAVPKGLFGVPNPSPTLAVARLCVPEEDVRALGQDLQVIVEAARELAEHPVAPHLIAAAEAVFADLAWPSGEDAYLSRLEIGVNFNAANIWTLPPDRPNPEPLPDDLRDGVTRARATLHARLAALREHFPPSGALALSGHAHLDLAWLWPVEETKRKGRRTFETILQLMDRFPDFTFNQSSAQLYAWLEEEHPDLFERIRARVIEGRLETVGGMWVEPDAQMTGGESLARQLLYGQRYFVSRFGRTSRVAWLPDTFGFTGALPQLLLEGGVDGFFTTKLSWNSTTPFPHDVWLWEGIDGSRVVAHAFKNDTPGTPGLGSYNGDISPSHLLRTWKNDRSRTVAAWQARAPESLFTYGFGDGAGGPSAEMLQRFELLRDFPAMPRLRHVRVDDFFATLPNEGLPVWTGEMYLELHRGTLSSQARTKRLNRVAEHRLVEAEVAASLAGTGDATTLENAWKLLLLNQFHDILPGSSIREVYVRTEAELERVVREAAAARDAALRALSGGEEGVTVWNLSLTPRPLRAVLPGGTTGVTLDGLALTTQATDGGTLVVAPSVLVPPLGSVVLDVTGGAEVAPGVRVEGRGDTHVLQNDHLTVVIGADGTLHRVHDRVADREVLSTRGNRIVAFRDVPRDWEAWDVEPETQDPARGDEIVATAVRIVEDGPARASVEVVRQWRGSTITQTYRLHAGSRRLDIETDIDWHERRTALRAFFDVAVRAPHATFETAFGVHQRATHRNTPYDAARHEVSAHRFLDLSESGYGVALLNDGRYGHSVFASTLSVTLVRGPLYPDPTADLGRHTFTYALYPHADDWTRAGVDDEALDLNSPLVAVPGRAEATPPVRLSGLPVRLGALKPAEDGDGLILRVYEGRGARGTIEVRVQEGHEVTRVNLLEEPRDAGRPEPTGPGTYRLAVRPFEVVTLAIRGGRAEA